MSQYLKTAVHIKMIILLSFSYSNSVQSQPSISEHQTAQFISKWEAAVKCEIWTILLRRVMEFREPTRGIGKIFHRKLWSLYITVF